MAACAVGGGLDKINASVKERKSRNARQVGLDQSSFFDSNAMCFDQKQFSGPVFRPGIFVQIGKQAHHDRRKGFRMIFHLQCDNAAEF
ncbi:MAG: hypothetical protein QOH42_1439 [Blastocatellia bacterium]|nr:hypothetical protein [Blastocatellia bacterium]